MRAFIISDTHLGIHPIHLDFWLEEIIMDYFDNFFFPTVNKLKKPGDIILHLGDFFHDRNQLYVKVLMQGHKLAHQLAECLPTHILLGNHDLWNESTRHIHSLSWMQDIENLTLYQNPTEVNWSGKNCLMMPYEQSKKKELAILNNTNADFVFCHSDLKGAKTNPKVELKEGLEIEDFQKFKQVWSGHIHLCQKIRNFQFCGSPYEMDRNDRGNTKGIWLLDFETGESQFIENTRSPRYKLMEIKNIEDIKNLSEDKNNDHIDLVISRELFFQNADARVKIEKIIREKNFDRMEWSDDLELNNLDNVELPNAKDWQKLDTQTLVYDLLLAQSKIDRFGDSKSQEALKNIVDDLFDVWKIKTK